MFRHQKKVRNDGKLSHSNPQKIEQDLFLRKPLMYHSQKILRHFLLLHNANQYETTKKVLKLICSFFFFFMSWYFFYFHPLMGNRKQNIKISQTINLRSNLVVNATCKQEVFLYICTENGNKNKNMKKYRRSANS